MNNIIKIYKKYSDVINISVLLALAFYLRIKTISVHSFWLDELVQIATATLSFGEIIKDISVIHLSPPLDIFITNMMLKISHSHVWLRLPAACFGTLSVGLVYLIGKRLFNSAVGFIAAFLFLYAPAMYFYSIELRMYGLLMFLSALAAFLLIEVCYKQRGIFWLMLVNILGVYTHYYYWAFLAIQVLLATYLLWNKEKKYLGRVLLSLAIAGSTALLWLPVLLKQIYFLNGHLSYGLKPNLEFFKKCLYIFLAWGQTPLKYWYIWSISVSSLLILTRPNRNVLFVFSWLYLPLLGFFGLSFFKQTVTCRNLIFIYPAYFLIIGYGLYLFLEYVADGILRIIQLLTKINYSKSIRTLAEMFSSTLIMVITIVLIVYLSFNITNYHSRFRNLKPKWQQCASQLDTLTLKKTIYVDSTLTKQALLFYYDYPQFNRGLGFRIRKGEGITLGDYAPSLNKKRIMILEEEIPVEEVVKNKNALIICRHDLAKKIQPYVEQFYWDDDKEICWRDTIRTYRIK